MRDGTFSDRKMQVKSHLKSQRQAVTYSEPAMIEKMKVLIHPEGTLEVTAMALFYLVKVNV